MSTKHFGDLTHWGRQFNAGGLEHGWMPPGTQWFIGTSDPYWGRVLDGARTSYGDPDIHYSTDDPSQDRHLVFGDGSALPQDGAVVYHDAARNQNWAQNDDGTASLLGPDGKPGPPIAPTGYHKVGDHYAPVDAHGQQIAPQLSGVPSSDDGFYTDPKTGMLTPKNANGDYFTVGPDGKKAFFDKTGAPITANQFNNATKPRDPAQGPAPDGGLATDEQQSGKAADAVKKLQDELKHRYSTISDAEEKLSEVLLNARATTSAGQQKLNDVQKKIVEAVNNPTMAMDTPAGERSFLTFLRTQVSAINDVLSSGSMSAQDQGKTAQALAALYAADSAAGTNGDPAAQQPGPPPAPSAPAPEPDPGGSADPGIGDSGLGPAPQMPDPSLSDVLGGSPMGADPLSSLASTLPSALSGLGGLGGGAGSPLDSLGGLAGAAAPLAGLASGLGDQGANHDHGSATTDKPDKANDSTDSAKDGKDGKADPSKADTTQPAGGNNQQPPAGQPDQQNPNAGGPPPPVAPPAGPSTAVKLPDGSPATARTPQTAQAIRDYLGGDTIDAAYRKNGIQLPPPGTPVTSPVDPSHLSCGDVAMFKDHYVPVLSAVKAFMNGQVVPLGSVSSSPDFLGFIDPTAAATASTPAGPPVSAPVSPPAPAAPQAAVSPPASGLAEPSPVG